MRLDRWYLHAVVTRSVSFEYPRIVPCTQTDHTSNNLVPSTDHIFSSRRPLASVTPTTNHPFRFVARSLTTSRHTLTENAISWDYEGRRYPTRESSRLISMKNATSVDGQHAWTAQIDSIVTQDLALPNPAPRLPYLVPRRQSIKVTSLSLTLYLSFSFSLPLVLVSLLRLSVRLWVSWLSRALSILDSRFAVSIKNDYPMEDRSATFLGNRG